MNILLLTKYSRMGSTSRVRAFQYLPYLSSRGIRVTQAPLFGDEYLRRRYGEKKIGYGLLWAAYLRRIASVVRSFSFRLVWIEKELLPSLPSWGEALLAACGIPYVVDYDDATFHWYDAHRNGLMRRFLGQKIDRVMRDAALVIVGNDYLAARARQAGAKRVEFLPSVVDLKRYGSGVRQEEDSEGFTVGWIGSPVTVHYLKLVESALIQVCKNGSTRIIVVGAKRAPLDGLNLETRPWSEDTEVEDIQSFDVGIMPLADTPWEQGKCGYKLIQYMACWKPIVASPVGINQKIVENGINGFLAVTTDEWICALEKLRNNYQCRRDMGKRGRSKVEMEYSLQIMAPRLESLLRSVIEKYP